MNRIIGRYDEGHHGTLLVCFGAMHGNEGAGVEGLKTVFQMLENEKTKNPLFRFHGRIVGMIGNKNAFLQQKRYETKDLNRQFTPQNIERVLGETNEKLLDAEDKELAEIISTIRQEIANYHPTRLVILDLHTTSAEGGVFCIVSEDEESTQIARTFYAPVVQGLVGGIGGTTLHYFRTQHFEGLPTVAVSFEAGQHQEPYSAKRVVAVTINCLRAIGCVKPEDVENRHDLILRQYSEQLPKVVRLIKVHQVQPDDEFQMRPNYHNFQPVMRGEVLAEDRYGVIEAHQDAYILMPLYQKQGSDGFFLVIDV